ncbi:MAG: ORF6N domain-containing protein [Bacteroidales bacterium]|nr:ORF6N domain-containing protein [Bacteroidales bacterium]
MKSWGRTRKLPCAFTEKGLYMLATILKSPQTTQTTIAIVETFAKLKQLTNNITALNSMETEVLEPEIIESTGGLLNEFSNISRNFARTQSRCNEIET